jgi:predicted lipoprotein with Yx(FWY)xxD motif
VTRRLGHRPSIRVDSDHQHIGFPASASDHRLSSTCAEIDDGPPVASRQLFELADVQFEQTPTDHLTHSAILDAKPLHECGRKVIGRMVARRMGVNTVRIGILSLLAASLVACSVVPGASPSPAPVPTETLASPTQAPTASPAMETANPTEGTSAPQTPDSTPYQNPGSDYDYDYRYDTPATKAPDSSPSAGDPVLATAESTEHGTYLVGSDGRALYMFASDHAGMSTCTGDCAESWPPLIIEEDSAPVAADGIDGTLSTVTRADGSLQLAYDDAALYYFSGDSAPGDTNGHGINDVWFLAEP